MAFVERHGHRLVLNGRPFRFVGVNIPNLHIIEDGPPESPWIVPDAWEVEDAVRTAKHIGGDKAVLRIYTPRFGLPSSPNPELLHVVLPREFNESLFVAYDRILETAGRHGVKVIIPFVNPWPGEKWGGTETYEKFFGENLGSFFTSSRIRDLFFEFVSYLLNRINTLTNVRYGDDPTILCWQSGNELHHIHGRPPAAFTRAVAAHAKRLAPRHLFCDGSTNGEGGFGWPDEVLADPNVDMVTTHTYSNMEAGFVRKLCDSVRGHGKALFVGEFGFNDVRKVGSFVGGIAGLQDCAGALFWSLRFRARGGGFYSHHEFDNFFALHHPGFAARVSEGFPEDEAEHWTALTAAAAKIAGAKVPKLPVPDAPVLLAVRVEKLPSGAKCWLRWRSSTFAEGYAVERKADDGAWEPLRPGKSVRPSGLAGIGAALGLGKGGDRASWIQDNVNAVNGGEAFADELRAVVSKVAYRIAARNATGGSPWSNEVEVSL
ncbi:glycoside hydrolase superfamily [Hyaloraphidium curvatum]|nr:glycoside hydrolase superfamily [Hyaloraphidium curvatum]